MSEHPGAVTFKGGPLTLVGELLSVGASAPDVSLVTNTLGAAKVSNYKGKVVVISTVPSLDTPVCDAETRRFNEEAGRLGADVAVLTVSADLPFAQSRWCGAAGIDHVVTLSDHRGLEFAKAYGVLIKELQLLARCIFVLDKSGKVSYVQLVKEVADEPDYEEVLEAVKKVS